MFDTNKFIENTISYTQFLDKKKNHLEDFRNTEDYLKKYREKLNLLEKTAKEAGLSSFLNIETLLKEFLKEFKFENLNENTDTVYAVIEFLKNNERELKKISSVLKDIKSLWEEIARAEEDSFKEVNFLSALDKTVQDINKTFESSSFDELSRLESEADKVKKNLLDLVDIKDYFKNILDKYVFIGDDSKDLQKEIEFFVNELYYKGSIDEVLMNKRKIKERFNEIKNKESSTYRKAFPVVRLQRKDMNDVFLYSFREGDEVFDNQKEINFKDYKVIETNKFIYIDQYPKSGVFLKTKLAEEMELTKDHYAAMAEFEEKSYTYYASIFGALFILSILSLFGLVSLYLLVPAIIVSAISYKFLFMHQKKKIDEKYNIPKSFYFIPSSNYLFVNEGDYGLDVDYIKITILLNDKKTFLKE